MKTNFKLLGGGLMLTGLLMVGGCGSDNNYVAPVVAPPVQTTAAVKATDVTVAAGAVTTAAAVTVAAPATAPVAVQKAAVSIPTVGTIITAKNASGAAVALTAAPTFVFQAPANATATSAGTAAGFATAPSVLIDIQIQGVASAAFSKPITLTLPVPGKAAGSVIADIYKNKNDGKGYLRVGGPYTVAADSTIAVSVSDLCVFTDKIGTATNTHTTASSGGTQVF